ncbi:hypothetical protein LINGRAHAP2_LOCUS17620, partial [Linum grandiflorum]
GYQKVRVQLDSQVAIQILLGDGELTHRHSSEVASFRKLVDWDWLIKVGHIYREDNQPTDYLDDVGHRLPLGVSLIDISHHTLSLHLLYDLLEVSHSR